MNRTTAYGIRFSQGWWSGDVTETDRVEMRFSYDIVDATLLRDRRLADDIAAAIGGTVKQVDLVTD